jgi:hypothetical protein
VKLLVTPCHGFAGKWRWDLVDTETGEVLAAGERFDTPREARVGAKAWRSRVYNTPIEMGT